MTGLLHWGLPGQVAQLVEQRTENPRVGGSIPSLATTHIRHPSASGGVTFPVTAADDAVSLRINGHRTWHW